MVQILMSTYNGERYLEEQLDSLLNQNYKNIQILIRDDGSTDKTVSILQKYSEVNHNIQYYQGDNIGVQQSFYNLLMHVDSNARYIATCDQDDIWLSDKIQVAVDALEKESGKVLYCCKPQLVDEKLNPIMGTLQKDEPRISFGNAMIENICTGCTMVMNRELYDFFGGNYPSDSLIHDWWIYMVAVGFGKVIYDKETHILYRQHAGNQIGIDSNRLSLIRRQIKTFRKFRGTYTKQLIEFNQTFYLDEENKYLAELIIGTRHSVKCRWKVLFEKRIYRQGYFDTLIFKGLLFMGLL